MGSVNLIVIVESVMKVAQHSGDELNKFHLPSLIAVAAALGDYEFVIFTMNYH